jgi:hypothetical protein
MSLGRIHIEVDLGFPQTRRYLASETFHATDPSGERLTPEELARPLLVAWRKVQTQAEMTLLLYGFEGVAASGGEEE